MLLLLFYGLPALLLFTLIGAGKGIKDKYFDSRTDNIPFNSAYNLKQEEPEQKQFVPYKEEPVKQKPFRLFYIGIALLGAAFVAYVILSFVLFGY